MSQDYQFQIPGHESIYINSKSCNERKINIYFSEPDKGINSDTGIVLFIAGFGGHATSNVYAKMRREFADKYNLVTVQCDYFGYEFMQHANKINNLRMDKDIKKIFSKDEINQIYPGGVLDLNELILICNNYNQNLHITASADLSGETPEYFNDMGMLQAIDNITSVLSVMKIIYNNNFELNAKKVILYGHSHGAYLSYLCNAFAPNLFSLIVDNSGWLFPLYFDSHRWLNNRIGHIDFKVNFDYLAKQLDYDKQLLFLPDLYSKFNNSCHILSFHGTTDTLISHIDKKSFLGKVDKTIYYEVSANKVDNITFKSTNHGLDADFLNLFEFTFKNFDIPFAKSMFFDLPHNVTIQTNNHQYSIDYCEFIPKIKMT